MSSLKSKREAQAVAVEAYKLDKEIVAKMAELRALKALLKEYLDEANEKELVVNSSTKTLTTKRIDQINIEYIVSKLKEKMRHEIFEEVTSKKIFISEPTMLITLLRKHGVPVNEFKKFIDIEYTVDKDKIRQLYSIGDIEPDEVRDTFVATVIKKIVFKIGDRKNDTNND